MLRPLAMAAERANRPTAIVVFSVALLLGAVIFLLWSARGVNAAEQRLERAVAEAAAVNDVAAQIRRIREEGSQAAPEDAKYRPAANLLSTISTASDRIGMSTRPQITPQRDDEQLRGPLVRRNIGARITGQEIGDALRWIETVVGQVDGLYVSQFKVTPSRTTGWNIDVRFSRWELKQ
ncbi:MAG: hypothetical protein ACTS27_00690 [Phycisphaerales bacterium]